MFLLVLDACDSLLYGESSIRYLLEEQNETETET